MDTPINKINLADLRREALAGLTTSFAMVPETVAFAFVAGVNPLVGLYASFTSGLVAALWGGRPGMISGGAGSLAVVSVALVASHGVEYLFAAVFLMGLIQALIGVLRWGKFIELVPHPVMLGFVNGLAIVILLAQLKQLPWGQPNLVATLALAAVTVLIVAFLPKLTRVVPAPLAAIGVVTVLAKLLPLGVTLVGDKAQIAGGFPLFHLPAVPLTLETLQIVLPYGILLAGVGLTESLLTQQLVDEVTDTDSSPDRECVGQGLGNIATGLFGGMGGCAMIGQTVINLESGGRSKLSGAVEALSILAFIVVASKVIGAVPLAALVGVMLVVVFRTFAWTSLKDLFRIPRTDAFVLVLVTAITVWKDLATAVFVGVLVSALAFAWQSAAKLTIVREDTADGISLYVVFGTIFFGSARRFARAFTPESDLERVRIDFSHANLLGHSAHEAVEALARRYTLQEKKLTLAHLSPECIHLLTRAGSKADCESEPRHRATEAEAMAS
jgi:sulfate permease, SulP family